MESFSIFAHGRELDVDRLVREVPLPFDRVWRRGEPLPTCGLGEYPTSGAEIVLGCGKTLAIRVQERIAEEFLASHRGPLLEMVRAEGIECCVLGLQYHLSFQPDRRRFCVSPSTKFLRAALDLGIRPVIYGTLDPA